MKRTTLQQSTIEGKAYRVGDSVRFVASKRFGPITSAGASITLPGRFIIQAMELRSKSRVYFTVRGVDKVSGTFTVFVSGPAYLSACVRWRAYRVRPAEIKTPKRKAKR